MGDDKPRKTASIDDWMVRISFAEAGVPDMGFKETGEEVVRKSKLALEKVMESCPNTRVIFITGYATVEVAREALVKGAFDFIAKPFKPKELRGVINKAALSLGHRGIL